MNTASVLNWLIGGLFCGLVATLGVWLWISREAWKQFIGNPDSHMSAGEFWIVSLKALVSPRFLRLFVVVSALCAASLWAIKLAGSA